MIANEEAIERLTNQVLQIGPLKRGRRFSPEFARWKRDTQVALTHIFDDRSSQVDDFSNISYSLSLYSTSTPEESHDEAFCRGLEKAEAIIGSIIHEIELYRNDTPTSNRSGSSSQHLSDDAPRHANNKVFVVHGHDSGTKETVARFLSRIGLDPIILHEKASKGDTIIEKLERHSDAAFAIVIMTPDDVGAPADKQENLRPRARQNVILELGYFIGKLGRERVVGLLRDEVEIPSDYVGVMYIPIGDNDAWKLNLVKEFRSAGFDVDANDAL